MADRPALAAERRTVTGKAVARLRKQGRLPAVVFGHGTESEAVTVDAHEFDLLRKHAGASTLVDLKVEGGKARPVLLSNIQFHPVNRHPIHVDLFAVRMTEELTVDVPLVGTGSAPATELGGTLMYPITTVKVRALPGNLPEQLTYDLSPLTEMDSTITLAEVAVPDGVTLQHDTSEVIARVLAPRVEAEAEETAAGAEGAEGEAGEAAAEGEAGESASEGASEEA